MLIHIGYHKAGSTWLQKHLFSRPNLGFFPLCPPETNWPAERRPKYLASFFVYSANGQLLSPFDFHKEEVLDQFRAIGQAAEGIVPCISSERLSGNPHASGFDSRTICDRIHAAFPKARILIVIREQVSAILSTYFQYLRNGGHRSLRHYLTTKYDGRRPGFSFEHFRYDKLIHYYRSSFGDEGVLVLPFEMMKMEPSAFVASIGDHVDLEIDAVLPFEERINQGSPRLVEIKTRYLNLLKRSDSVNGYALPSSRLNRRSIIALRRGLARYTPAGWEKSCIQRLSSECRELCSNRFSESNRRTGELIGCDLRSIYGYM